MSSVGGFQKGEIDGEPFYIFTFLPQIDSLPSSSSSVEVTADPSGNDNLPLEPLFICPYLRLMAEWLLNGEAAYFHPCQVSPHFPSRTSGDQQLQRFVYEEDIDICKLPVIPLFWCNNEGSNEEEFCCRICSSPDLRTNYYFCVTCDNVFHKECVESPVFIKHPSYPFLSLQLYRVSSFPGYLWECFLCKEDIPVNEMAYHCPTSNLSMHLVCALKPIPIAINHSKRHPHPLTLFPKQAFLPCDLCGLIINSIPMYACVQCVFIGHQDCVFFPRVIRISRHHHHISFHSSLPLGKWFCRICLHTIDNGYGAYTCTKCDNYFFHSRCALRKDLWDGEELKGVIEEPEVVVDPFETIADGIILHFSHDHHLKLEISRVYDENKFCQACVLPVFEGNYYSCVDHCDFILHEACAVSPLKKHHPLHAHSLTLKVVTNEYDNGKGYFRCDVCWLNSCGFVYESHLGYKSFRLDLRCASVTEPFEYEGHEHPLFLALTPEEERSTTCQICKDTGYNSNSSRKLNCIECDYVICFRCATLPYKVRYEDDKHLLLFREGKKASHRTNWCELCEREIVCTDEEGFYACDDYCCTTLHVQCLLGKDPYMKPGQTIKEEKKEVHVHRNNTTLRPFCYGSRPEGTCKEGRCPYKVVFEKENKTFCSYNCAME